MSLPSVLTSRILGEAGIKDFFRWLAVDQRCSFHPDDALSDIVDGEGKPAFAGATLVLAEDRMMDCWDLVALDVVSLDRLYEIGIDALAEAMEEEPSVDDSTPCPACGDPACDSPYLTGCEAGK